MNFNKILIEIEKSTIVFDESSLFWLIKTNILSLIWKRMNNTAKSIAVASETFYKMLRQLETIIESEATTTSERLILSELQQANQLLNENKCLYSVNSKLEDIKNLCYSIGIKKYDEKLVEPIALIALLSEHNKNIFFITDNVYLKKIILTLFDKGLIKAKIYFSTIYHFILFFYTKCSVDFNKFFE